MSKVLVTGCNGFIGKKVTNMLIEKGFHVIGLSTNEEASFRSENFEYMGADITDYYSMEEIFNSESISHVIHLAAIAHLKSRKHLDWNDFYRTNTLASKNLFKLANERECDVFFASTVDVYGEQNAETIHEGIETNPTSHYGLSKELAEKQLLKIFNNTPSNNASFTIARFAPVYGEGNMKDIYKRVYINYPNLAYRLTKGVAFHFVSVNNILDFVNKWIQGSRKVTGIYNICDKDTVTNEQLVKLERKHKKAKRTVYLPLTLIKAVGFTLRTFNKIIKIKFVNKVSTNLYKLISPPKYSIENTEKILEPAWDIKNTVYNNKGSKKNGE